MVWFENSSFHSTYNFGIMRWKFYLNLQNNKLIRRDKRNWRPYKSWNVLINLNWPMLTQKCSEFWAKFTLTANCLITHLHFLLSHCRDMEIIHQREIKDLQNSHMMERCSLEQRDHQNLQEIETLHRKCRCLTKLYVVFQPFLLALSYKLQ